MSFESMADSVQRAAAYVASEGDRGRARRDDQQRRSLAAQYYGGQVAPENAQRFLGDVAQAGGDAEGFRKQAFTRAAQRAAMLVDAPDAMKPQAYGELARELQGIGFQVPQQYDPQALPMIAKFAQLHGAGGGDDPYKPMNVSPGGEIVDPRTGKVIHSNTNFAPMKPQYDSARGGYALPPGQGDGGQGFVQVAPPRPNYEADRLQLARDAAARADQAAADAADTRRRARFGSAPAGQRFRDDGTLEPIPGYRPPVTAAERKDSLARRAKQPQLANVARGLDRIDQALSGLDMPLVNTGPMDQYAVRKLPSGQELEAAVGGIPNSLLSLTRVPGIGSQSDLEARIAALQYPGLDKDPEVNRRTMEQLRAFVQDLQDAYRIAGEADAEVYDGSAPAPAAAPASPAPRATNPQTGEVVEYRNGQWVRVSP